MHVSHLCCAVLCCVTASLIASGGTRCAAHVCVHGAGAAEGGAVSADQLRAAALPHQVSQWGAPPAADAVPVVRESFV